MKKIQLLSLVAVICFLIPFILTGCGDPSYSKCPAKQPGTQWQSEDGKIFINSDEEGKTSGYVRFGNERVPVDFHFDSSGYISITTYETADGYSAEIGYFQRSGSYGADSFSMTLPSMSRIKSTVIDIKEDVRIKKIAEKKMTEFDISEYAGSSVLKNSETIFNATDDMYSSLYMDYERSEHSGFDAFLIAAALVDKGCKTAVNCSSAQIESGILTVNCTDGSGKSYEISCDCVKHIIVE